MRVHFAYLQFIFNGKRKSVTHFEIGTYFDDDIAKLNRRDIGQFFGKAVVP